MSSEAPSFNLVSDPWLPVTLVETGAGSNKDQSTEQFGLRELFSRAHEVVGLYEPSPLTYTAIMRYLLAILHRALKGPADEYEWAKLWNEGRFTDPRIGKYLEDYRERFELFHPERPFAQVESTSELPKSSTSPVTRLSMERTSGNNPTLFDHSRDDTPPALSSAEAARALLTAHGYAFAGSRGHFFNSPLIAGYHIMLAGDTFYRTLLYNLQEYSEHKPNGLEITDDSPWWERSSDPRQRKGGNEPDGLTDLLTWRSRAIRLLPEPDGTVRQVQYVQWYQLKEFDGFRDPFKRYEQAKSGPSVGKSFPRNFTAGRALWRDSDALIEEGERSGVVLERERPGIVTWVNIATRALGEEGQRLRPLIVATGLVNNKASIDLWRMDRVPLPTSVLHDQERRLAVSNAISMAQDVREALRVAGTAYAECALDIRYDPRRKPKDNPSRPNPDAVARERRFLKLDERYWSQLDTAFQCFMIGLGTDSDRDEASRTWTNSLRDLARRVFREATSVLVIDSRRHRAQAIGAGVLERMMRERLPQSPAPSSATTVSKGVA